MIGAILGAAAGIASSIWGGIQARKNAELAQAEMDKQQTELDRQRQRANEDYRRRYNEDYTQSAVAQAMLNRSRAAAMEQINNAKGTASVMGGDARQVAAAQENANKMVSDVQSSVAQQATARKDAAEAQHQAAERAASAQQMQLYGQQANVYNQRAAANTQAANQGIAAGLNMAAADAQASMNGAGLFEDLFKKK